MHHCRCFPCTIVGYPYTGVPIHSMHLSPVFLTLVPLYTSVPAPHACTVFTAFSALMPLHWCSDIPCTSPGTAELPTLASQHCSPPNSPSALVFSHINNSFLIHRATTFYTLFYVHRATTFLIHRATTFYTLFNFSSSRLFGS